LEIFIYISNEVQILVLNQN